MSLSDDEVMNDAIRVAAIQMISTSSVPENLETAGRLIADAVRQGAKLVVLPEYFSIMGLRDTDKLAVSEVDCEGVVQSFLATTAKLHAVWLVGGSLPLVSETSEKVRNTCMVFSPDGERVARYDKIHLFGYQSGSEEYNESRTIEPGAQVVVVDTPFARIGVAICYDLRFPELFRAMGEVDLIVLPAAFTETTGRAHWETLLRARAIENQTYVLAAAQGGVHPSGRETHGNSMLIDPWGEITARLPKGEGVVIGELDRARLEKVRASLPALQHRISTLFN